jgi:hypothetical protein
MRKVPKRKKVHPILFLNALKLRGTIMLGRHTTWPVGAMCKLTECGHRLEACKFYKRVYIGRNVNYCNAHHTTLLRSRDKV